MPADVKADRANRLMDLQREISAELNAARVGKTLRILIDRKEGEYYVGRSEHDSPEVDNEVLIPAEDHYLRIGDFVLARIVDSSEYDLFGELV